MRLHRPPGRPAVPLSYRVAPTPIGRLLLVADATGLVRVAFAGTWSPAEIGADWSAGGAIVDAAARELDAYFAGSRRAFAVPRAARGTPFQRRVWDALVAIPYGTTTSYAALARAIGAPAAVRAVGAANGRNPLPIVVPCHRVVGADGSLTGFGGGLALKRRLLALEGAEPGADAGQRRLPL
jgi:methylated-DNA-[protein]-cysteine S-methyltransferase